MMKPLLRRTAVLLGALLLLGACASYSTSAAQAPVVQDLPGLVDALQANGAVVKQGGEVSQSYFSVAGQQITVDGAPVQVYEYASDTVLSDEIGMISPDGYLIDRAAVDWAGQPTMWNHGKLLVILVGNYPAAVESLTTVLGDPFIQAPPME